MIRRSRKHLLLFTGFKKWIGEIYHGSVRRLAHVLRGAISFFFAVLFINKVVTYPSCLEPRQKGVLAHSATLVAQIYSCLRGPHPHN